MGERVAFPMEGNQNTLNPLNNKANENKYGGLINLDREENLFDQLKTPIISKRNKGHQQSTSE